MNDICFEEEEEEEEEEEGREQGEEKEDRLNFEWVNSHILKI